LLTIDSISTDNTTTPTLFKVYRGSTQLNPDIPAGAQITVVALTDSSSTAKANSYATGKMLADGLASVGSAEIAAITAMGSTIKAFNVGGGLNMTTSAAAMSDRRCYLQPVYLQTAATITGVGWLQSAQGDYTAANYNGVGLYSVSGSVLTLVASSTNDGNIWKATANTYTTKAFTTPYVAAKGLYYVALLYSWTSAHAVDPTLTRLLGVITGMNTMFTNSLVQYAYKDTQTTLPSPTLDLSSGWTVSNAPFWVTIY
jgi:hypothetical protein